MRQGGILPGNKSFVGVHTQLLDDLAAIEHPVSELGAVREHSHSLALQAKCLKNCLNFFLFREQ